MQLEVLLDEFGYSNSGSFLRRGTVDFERAPDIGHILRAAAGNDCRLEGVYTLRPFEDAQNRLKAGSIVPVVYVCTADNEDVANRIHRFVWNQDIVPFLLVHTPRGLRLYSGFERTPGDTNSGLLEPLIEFNQIQERLAEFRADAIDSGELWQRRGARIRPEARVYWSLLDSLRELAAKLREEYGLDKRTIHPLIGKYVYLHYLRDRGFLSERRLNEWQIDATAVFGRTATLTGLREICRRLDSFLNGRVFPIKFGGEFAPGQDHVQRVAAAFAGDVFEGGWQFHLPFDAYSFTYIPIETLSMIYEQFLHTPTHASDGDEENNDEENGHTEGRKAGAYYTPIPVVNFMLAELDERRRLKRGVRVWDPSCGSGAFLVQCYRRLIERTFPRSKKKPTPAELASLLKRHIFGVDMDDDACSVTEFSLYLTLLDYVQPSDLVDHPRFRLPALRGNNIFCQDFFATEPFAKARFHWIAGNPPWKQLKTAKLEKRDDLAMKWMRDHKIEYPVGMYSLSQAFAWRCREFLHRDGVCALLLPAMTLFEDPSRDFRKAFFRQHRIYSVANFSNLAEVLFARRARVPAAAFCFGLRDKKAVPNDLEMTRVFSPLVANQEATRPVTAKVRNETWSLAVNGDEIRELPYCDVASGSGLPWKLATWGSGLDQSLLARLRSKFDSLENYEARWHAGEKEFLRTDPNRVFKISQGLEIRTDGGSEHVQRVPAIAGKNIVNVVALARYRRIFSFPSFALSALPKGKEYVRKGRSELPLTVCQPPHIIVSAARNFAVFSDEFLIVPPRQIGIASVNDNRPLLKALALYLSSDFAYYHQFLTSTELGVKRDRATLEALRHIPMPLLDRSESELQQWANLHDRLAKTQPRVLGEMNQPEAELNEEIAADGQQAMLEELNDLVATVLGLDEVERVQVEDLVRIRLALNDGKLGKEAMTNASVAELRTYAEWLRREMESQEDEENPSHYAVTVLCDDRSGFVAIEQTKDAAAAKVRVLRAGRQDAEALVRVRKTLRREAGQWIYFDRALRIYRPRKTYLFKPIHRLHWTRSRAVLDAADLQLGVIQSAPDA